MISNERASPAVSPMKLISEYALYLMMLRIAVLKKFLSMTIEVDQTGSTAKPRGGLQNFCGRITGHQLVVIHIGGQKRVHRICVHCFATTILRFKSNFLPCSSQ